jgi:RNA polymerase sigma-70 factor (ECF subfamily)
MPSSKNNIISWVSLYTSDLFAYSLVRVGRKEIAEDLVQETFLSAYQSYQNFEGKSTAKTWLFSILKHKIADHYRAKYKKGIEVSSSLPQNYFDENDRWKEEFKPIKWPAEKELTDDPNFKKALNHCMESLPEKWSSVVRLKFLEEQDSKAVCSTLEITSSNFWQIIHRAKLQLRNCLEVKWFKK